MTEGNNAPKFTFFYLLSLVALIFVSISLGMIAFNIINIKIIDVFAPLSSYNLLSYNSQFRFAISALLIASPIYYVMTALIRKGVREKQIAHDSGVRKWLTYFTLLVSSLIILGVLIGILNTYLSGDLNTRFILKALVVFVLAGLVFAYYLFDLYQAVVVKNNKVVLSFFLASLLLIVVAFVSAFVMMESPAQARLRKADEPTLAQLSRVENALNSYYDLNQDLPIELDFPGLYPIKDSERVKVDYLRLDETNYQICATFLSNKVGESDDYYYPSIYNQSYEAGYNCFTRSVWGALEPRAVNY